MEADDTERLFDSKSELITGRFNTDDLSCIQWSCGPLEGLSAGTAEVEGGVVDHEQDQLSGSHLTCVVPPPKRRFLRQPFLTKYEREVQLKRALHSIEHEGLSIREASRRFTLPKSSLSDRVRKMRQRSAAAWDHRLGCVVTHDNNNNGGVEEKHVIVDDTAGDVASAVGVGTVPFAGVGDVRFGGANGVLTGVGTPLSSGWPFVSTAPTAAATTNMYNTNSDFSPMRFVKPDSSSSLEMVFPPERTYSPIFLPIPVASSAAYAKDMTTRTVKYYADALVDFVNKSPSPFHVVEQARSRLTAAGFSELREADAWNLAPNGRYFVQRNQSLLMAFAVGGAWKPGNGFAMVGAHTDSPGLKVAPVSHSVSRSAVHVGVETYGGGLWYSWFDRDLQVAGRCLVREAGGGDRIHSRLVHVARPLMRVPSLAIHLNRNVNDGFAPNKETHINPIIATSEFEEIATKALQGNSSRVGADSNHASSLILALCRELQCAPRDIVNFDLHLSDCQPGCLGGADEEFIFAARLDNQLNCYAALEAMCETVGSLQTDSVIRMACLFDNEECGSRSAQGACSAFTDTVLRRVTAVLAANGGGPDHHARSMASSFLVSADQAHAVHPSYADKHRTTHAPRLHGGVIVKHNGNQSYATTAPTAAVVIEAARMAGLEGSDGPVPLQDFLVRQDMPCGSTIGPIVSSLLGVATADVGGPTLSMHSIREMVCTSSVQQTVRLMKSFYQNYASIRARLTV